MSRCRTRAATSRRYSAVERTSSIGWSSAAQRLGRAVGGLGRRRPALERGLGGRRADRRRPRPTRAPRRTSRPRRRRPPSRQASAMTTLLIDWARRVPTLRKRSSRPASERDADAQEQLVRRQRGPPVGRPEVARPGPSARRAAEPSTNDASAASRTGSVSPAGEALAMLPPSVPRFWIWAAPIVAAASTSAGRCSRQSAERRISV